uniref:Uncharacterized protein n=1 Tax=Arion vulgaris TaxID=1028688 RepID=A0A0B7AU16_9EUPU
MGSGNKQAHKYTEFKIDNSVMFTCGQAHQIAEHIHQDCLEYDILRQTHWSSEITLESKLHRLLYEQQRTEVYTKRQHCRYREYFKQRKGRKEGHSYHVSIDNRYDKKL